MVSASGCWMLLVSTVLMAASSVMAQPSQCTNAIAIINESIPRLGNFEDSFDIFERFDENIDYEADYTGCDATCTTKCSDMAD